LRHAGYEVHDLQSLDRLRLDLENDENVDAVIVSEATPHRAEQAATVVREHGDAPLILFRRPGTVLDESRFDRVYSEPTPTSYWLFDTAVLAMQSQRLRASSASVRSVFKRLRAEFEGLRAQSRRPLNESSAARARSQWARTKVRRDRPPRDG
jgi:hypothetical protein